MQDKEKKRIIVLGAGRVAGSAAMQRLANRLIVQDLVERVKATSPFDVLEQPKNPAAKIEISEVLRRPKK